VSDTIFCMRDVLGLDIGGANLKAAHTSGAALTWPFPLWRSPELLTEQLRALITALPAHELLAITMTGELCDCFASKAEGVRAILFAVEAASLAPVRVWTLRGAFVDLPTARAQPLASAAANWLALAALVGRRIEAKTALLLDCGSTTTDLVYLEEGVPRPRGHTDLERLRTGELVYTGLRRTPVCAVLGMDVAAEFFATMLDVYMVLGLVPEKADDVDTADRRPRTRANAHARLARLLCADADELSPAEVQDIARRARSRQVEHIGRAVERVLAGRSAPQKLILSGSGEVLGRQIAAHHPRLAPLPLVSLADHLGPGLSEAAAAYAVAVLAQAENG
jgi:(4-(4-[2-(gamma-L-glutamylamino)ethyl]phenoxymethyl)furan-2-yl)methanamine synthase